MADSKNEKAWCLLFEKYHILDTINEKGQFIINSEAINEFREARLMTKFDHSFQLPKIFADNKLSILPVTRGEYVISNIKTFCDFCPDNNMAVTDMTIPVHLESLDYNTITSEAMAINCAYVSGIINDFTGDSDLKPTVSGRMSSQNFSFRISLNTGKDDKSLGINVRNSQIEIDGGYEGEKSLNLIEAKNNIPSDFLIRQLYYPYRLWKNKISKTVRPLFLTYTNGIFHLREYKFTDINHYNSIQLIREKKYRIKEPSSLVIHARTIKKLLTDTPETAEPTNIPFPQADSFERIINLCEIINSQDFKSITREELSDSNQFTEKESFDPRQVDYYTNAAIYLGLIYKDKNVDNSIIYGQTSEGKKIFDLHITERQLKFAELILAHSAFKRTLNLYFQKTEIPSKDEIVRIMKTSHLYRMGSDSTFRRRASTIVSWTNWIINLIKEPLA